MEIKQTLHPWDYYLTNLRIKTRVFQNKSTTQDIFYITFSHGTFPLFSFKYYFTLVQLDYLILFSQVESIKKI